MERSQRTPRRKRKNEVSNYSVYSFMFVDKKKKVAIEYAPREQDNSDFRLLGSWKAGDWKQTYPPTIPVSQQFKEGSYPLGDICEYRDENRRRITDAEFREKERLF
jgi:hypothetical protein